MSTIIGDHTVYPTDFEGPDDGDERDASSHLVGFEALASRTEYLKDRVVDGTAPINTSSLTVVGDATIGDDLTVTDGIACDGLTCVDWTCSGDGVATGSISAGGGFFRSSVVTVTKVFSGPAETDSGWAVDRSTNDFYHVTTSTSQSKLRILLNPYLKNSANITQIVVRYKGAPGHAALPGGMPEIILYRKRVGPTGAASGIIDSEFDPSASTAAFQGEHDIPLVLGTSHTVSLSTHDYYLIIDSESDGGANAIAGAQFQGGKLTYEYNRVDET